MLVADDRLLLTLGVRHQNFDVRSYDYDTGVKGDDSYERSRNSPVLGVVWKLRDNLSAYANYIESLSQGGKIGRASCRERECQSCRSRWSPYLSNKKNTTKHVVNIT